MTATARFIMDTGVTLTCNKDEPEEAAITIARMFEPTTALALMYRFGEAVWMSGHIDPVKADGKVIGTVTMEGDVLPETGPQKTYDEIVETTLAKSLKFLNEDVAQ